MILGQKIKLKPNNKQKTYIRKACGNARLAWNWWLAQAKKKLQQNEKLDFFALKKEFNALKKTEYSFVYETTKRAVQQPFIYLKQAFSEYFRSKKWMPKFKKKKDGYGSFYIGNGGFKIIQTDNPKRPKLHIANLKTPIKMMEWLRFKEGRIVAWEILIEGNNYFVSLQIELPDYYLTDIYWKCENQARVGIDLWVSAVATLSDWTTLPNIRPLKSVLKKLKHEQRRFYRKTETYKRLWWIPESWSMKDFDKPKRYYKQLNKVRRIHLRVKQLRKNYLHQMTTYITRKYKYIALEDLNVSGMLKNHKLALAIADVWFYEFRRQIEYKALIRWNEVRFVDRRFASTKTCNKCWYRKDKDDMPLSERVFVCDKCWYKEDRDLNASINILKEAFKV